MSSSMNLYIINSMKRGNTEQSLKSDNGLTIRMKTVSQHSTWRNIVLAEKVVASNIELTKS